MALNEQGFDPDESMEDFVARRNKVPDLLVDHAAWLKWHLANTIKEDEAGTKWWTKQIQTFEGADWEWDKQLFEIKRTSWSIGLVNLKRTVREKNLDSKGLDLILSKEYRDVLAIFEDQLKSLEENIARLVSDHPILNPSPSAAPEIIRIYSQKGFSKTTIGKWLSTNESNDEKVYRDRFDEFIARYPKLVDQISDRQYRVCSEILREIYKTEKINPALPPTFPL